MPMLKKLTVEKKMTEKKVQEEIAAAQLGECLNIKVLGLPMSTFLSGVFDIPVTKLEEPPPSLRVGEIKDWYVKVLEDMFSSAHGDHEDLTAPLLAIVSVSSKSFSQSKIPHFSYTVCTISIMVMFWIPSRYLHMVDFAGYWWSTETYGNQQHQLSE